MKLVSEFRDSALAKGLISQIKQKSQKPVRLMEFCGSHTVSIFRYGIRQVLPPTVEMVSGPGCPICVTANSDLDKAIALAKFPNVIITTFGDMIKVPGSRSTLQEVKASGADVRMVYSTMDALKIAGENPNKSIVFLGIGFETTTPTVAASILQAEELGLKNYYVYSMHKICPPVIRALLDSGEVKLDGLICPGHVSVITGAGAWEFIAKEYGIPCVVAGFEPLDILQCIAMLVTQIEKGESKVEIAYRRSVHMEGNLQALKLMEHVFEPSTADWRGMGSVPGSGLKIRKKYQRFDAEYNFKIKPGKTVEPKGCICGEVLRGVKTPSECKLFRKACTPQSPVGPCMVSSEGTCSAYYLFGEDNGE
ncbi:MAG: hydrogenase formation protein HypD [Dehalococcoidales bacterium]|nr:hydrogenase formation protein HypD [Dehalococcoidales bacterium]